MTSNQMEIFRSDGQEIELPYDPDNQTFWASRQDIARIFQCSPQNVEQHLKYIFDEGELDEATTTKRDLVVQREGNRNVRRQVHKYNLDVILSIGYRVSTRRATLFRQWSNQVLSQYIIEGAALDEDRLAENPEAFQRVLETIRSIRTSEQELYAKVRGVFKSTASDYDSKSQAAQNFFAIAQDKFHYAILQKTAAQIRLARADASKPNVGLALMKGENPTTQDLDVAKNFLAEDELQGLTNICEQFLLFAESKAFRGQKMTMEEMATKLNVLLMANDYPVLYEYDGYERAKADKHVRSELKIYKARLKEAEERKALGAGDNNGEEQGITKDEFETVLERVTQPVGSEEGDSVE